MKNPNSFHILQVAWANHLLLSKSALAAVAENLERGSWNGWKSVKRGKFICSRVESVCYLLCARCHKSKFSEFSILPRLFHRLRFLGFSFSYGEQWKSEQNRKILGCLHFLGRSALLAVNCLIPFVYFSLTLRDRGINFQQAGRTLLCKTNKNFSECQSSRGNCVAWRNQSKSFPFFHISST